MKNNEYVRPLPKLFLLKEGLDLGLDFQEALNRANVIAQSDPTLCSHCASVLEWPGGFPKCPEGHEIQDTEPA